MTRILFVCLGNICRSCAAQTVMQSIVDRNQRQADFFIDSAGIIDYHEGEQADSRMRRHAFDRGYRITHLSRPVRQDDFRDFDYIIGMDDSNIKRLNAMAPSNADKGRIHRMTEWSRAFDVDEVPDPYYGGDKGFENVLDLLEDACQVLFDSLA
ncbi:MAG: low molecular weight phosphotyrosine protein phosphatase [Bacteroidaceae bacterium]|nr:low molecular weight phosphotyrosine protein phosphatase [Bacteroidaceae bacterium]